ncbi:hypothetical protein AGMMS50239_35830 [Bacteroidia bacterium]|nr:hypothetical protein AGMMS50239_35830 [Bacteroidia bacterium]
MKNYLLHSIAIYLFGFACSCQNNTGDQSCIDVINLSGWKFTDTENLSSIADSIEYVKLETSDNSLMGDGCFAYLSDKRIFISGGGRVLMFDRQGNFIKDLFNVGQGPGEGFARCCVLDHKNERFLMYNNFKNAIEVYDFDGNHIRTIRDHSASVVHTQSISVFKNFVILDNGNLIPDFFSAYHLDRNYLHLDSTDYSYLNTYSVKPKKVIRMFDAHCVGFQNMDSTFLIKEMFCDTLFSTHDFQVFLPEYIFQMGSKKADYETNIKMRSLEVPIDPHFEDGRYRIWSFLEVNNFLFLKVWTSREHNMERHLCLYDSSSKTVKIYNSEVFINNIDGGIDFNPFGFRIENHQVYQDKIYTLADPTELKEAVPKNRAYSSIQQRKKLEELTESLLDDDNPVLMIVKIKK